MTSVSNRIIPATDKMSVRQALNLVALLGSRVETFKVHAVAEQNLAPLVKEFRREGAKFTWVDYKLHDTPDTVAERAAQHRDAGVDMLTVHASGGPKMIAAAVENGPPIIIAVTLLTSLTDLQARELFNAEAAEVVRKLGLWAKEGGAHRIVCSPKQVKTLAEMEELKGLDLVVPGTRSAGVASNDQQQVDTPYNAVINGASYLVGGRQITQNPYPLDALEVMTQEIQPAFNQRWGEGMRLASSTT